jgi:hypothetical protein
MAADPLLFIGSLLDENLDTQTILNRNCRFPSISIERWISSESTEFPTISIFSHQGTPKPLGFESKHYLELRQVRVEIRTDNVEELHILEEEVKQVVRDNASFPQTRKYPDPVIELLVLNSNVDVFERVTDVIAYRRSLIIDTYTQYS